MKMTNKVFKLAPVVEERITRSVHSLSEPCLIGALCIFAAMQLTLWFGVLFTEGVPNMRAHIPEPGEAATAYTLTKVATIPTKSLGEPVVLYVQPVDVQRLAQTINQDVARHGGRIVAVDRNGRAWTFAVPTGYLDRIQPLVNGSGARPLSTAYQDWAEMVTAEPRNPDIGGLADFAVTIRLVIPLITNPITPKLIWWTTITSLAALLVIPIIAAANHFFEDP